MVDVGVRAWLPVAAERRLQRGARRRRAQPRVAVHVRRPDSRLADHRERVVLLQEELARRVEAEAAPPAGRVEQRPRALDDASHRRLPIARDQPAVFAQERLRQPVGRVVGLPAVHVLGIQAAAIDRSVARPRTPAIRPSWTAMSIPSPLECRTDADPTQRSTSTPSSPGSRWMSTRSAQPSPRPYAVRSPHGSSMRSITTADYPPKPVCGRPCQQDDQRASRGLMPARRSAGRRP